MGYPFEAEALEQAKAAVTLQDDEALFRDTEDTSFVASSFDRENNESENAHHRFERKGDFPTCLLPTIAPHEVIYKAGKPVIEDPARPIWTRPCHNKRQVHKYTPWSTQPSMRTRMSVKKNNLDHYKRKCQAVWHPNPSGSCPMRARKYTPMTLLGKPMEVEQWKCREECIKDCRDHLLAEDLGYETLVGNLVHINIPSGKDINRSWQNYLSSDEMEWGFPYFKGSRERLRSRLPEPYLAFQLQEEIWKWPRTRIAHGSSVYLDLDVKSKSSMLLHDPK